MKNNFIQKKTSQNVKLLTLLTNRQKACSVTDFKRSDWPGKHRPSFTQTIKIQTANQKHHLYISRRKSLNLIRSPYISELPTIRASLQGQLSLKPCESVPFLTRRQSSQTSETSRNIKSNKKSRNSSVIKIQQNQSTLIMSKLFKNLKISKQANQIIDKKLIQKPSQMDFIHTSLNRNHNKITQNVQNIPIMNKDQNETKQASPKKQQTNKFKIDFLAFGYIQKVMDNPQLWSKYVHKIEDKKRLNKV